MQVDLQTNLINQYDIVYIAKKAQLSLFFVDKNTYYDRGLKQIKLVKVSQCYLYILYIMWCCLAYLLYKTIC